MAVWVMQWGVGFSCSRCLETQRKCLCVFMDANLCVYSVFVYVGTTLHKWNCVWVCLCGSVHTCYYSCLCVCLFVDSSVYVCMHVSFCMGIHVLFSDFCPCLFLLLCSVSLSLRVCLATSASVFVCVCINHTTILLSLQISSVPRGTKVQHLRWSTGESLQEQTIVISVSLPLSKMQ